MAMTSRLGKHRSLFSTIGYRPTLIISGGQTGADFGALLGATECGIATGGVAPKGYRTERGPNPDLKNFGLLEHDSAYYPHRTEANVKWAHATLIIGRLTERGTALTIDLCERHGRPHHEIEWWPGHKQNIESCHSFLSKHRPAILNVAGNRESKNPGIERMVRQLIVQLFLDNTV